MSLRARVLVGMAAIAVVLGLAALAITQIIESHLVHQVDQQLASASRSFERSIQLCSRRLAAGAPGPGVAGADLDGDGRVDVPPPDATGATGSTTPLPSTGGDPRTTDTAETGGHMSPDAIEARATPLTIETSPDPSGASSSPPRGPTVLGEGPAPSGATGEPPPDQGFVVSCIEAPFDDAVLRTLGRLSSIDVGVVTRQGSDGGGSSSLAVIEPLIRDAPSSTAQPDVDTDQVMASARDHEPFTTGSAGPGPRHRVQAVANADIEVVFAVSQPLDAVDATVGRLVAVEALSTVAILGVLGLVAWWVIRHGIRPVKQMTATASAIAAGELSHRVPEHDDRTEAGQLGTALNQMLGRIEQAFDERSRSEARLRQFVSDASHELRTPVTTIRGYSELYDSGGLDEERELSEAMRRTRQEAVRMGDLVDDMLLLARLDEGRELQRKPVDVAALVRDAARDARAVDPERAVVTATRGPLDVLGDGDRLRQVIANLVGNALVHTPSSARLDLRARRDGDRAVVEVADRGPGMPPEMVRQAFDRFYRADPSRSRHRGGSGLGLSIVQATVTAHGGEVTLDSALGEGTTARITLPLTDCQGAHR